MSGERPNDVPLTASDAMRKMIADMAARKPMYHVETTTPVSDEMLAAYLCNLYNTGYFVQSIMEVGKPVSDPSIPNHQPLQRFRIIAYLRKG